MSIILCIVCVKYKDIRGDGCKTPIKQDTDAEAIANFELEWKEVESTGFTGTKNMRGGV